MRGRRVGGIFAYHQSRKRECNEGKMCMHTGCVCISVDRLGFGVSVCVRTRVKTNQCS